MTLAIWVLGMATIFSLQFDSTSAGLLIDADILRLLKESQRDSYYVLSPVHFLSASILTQNLLPVPVGNEASSSPDASKDNLTQPKDDYAPPKIDDGELTPKDTYGPPAPKATYGPPPPKDTYGPPAPKATYGPPTPPKDTYGPPTPPKDTYGPPAPKDIYGPPKVEKSSKTASETLILKSYVEPTFSFGELPLAAVADVSIKVLPDVTDKRPRKEGY